MANIGATTAFYKVETSLTRANNEVSKSMERLATGKQNATAGDRSSYQAMADTFRLDYVGTKAGIKGASVVMGYLETAMRTLDAASGVLSRLQELAVLGANETNTTEDADAIDFEAEKLGDEFHRLLSTAKYKGKDLFLSAAGGEYVSLGGRDAEMTFGVKKVAYTELYGTGTRTISGGASNAAVVNLVHLPSDAVAAKEEAREEAAAEVEAAVAAAKKEAATELEAAVAAAKKEGKKEAAKEVEAAVAAAKKEGKKEAAAELAAAARFVKGASRP